MLSVLSGGADDPKTWTWLEWSKQAGEKSRTGYPDRIGATLKTFSVKISSACLLLFGIRVRSKGSSPNSFIIGFLIRYFRTL